MKKKLILITFFSMVTLTILFPILIIAYGQIINKPKSLNIGKGPVGIFVCTYKEHYNSCDFDEFIQKQISWLPLILFFSSPFIVIGTATAYFIANKKLNKLKLDI